MNRRIFKRELLDFVKSICMNIALKWSPVFGFVINSTAFSEENLNEYVHYCYTINYKSSLYWLRFVSGLPSKLSRKFQRSRSKLTLYRYDYLRAGIVPQFVTLLWNAFAEKFLPARTPVHCDANCHINKPPDPSYAVAIPKLRCLQFSLHIIKHPFRKIAWTLPKLSSATKLYCSLNINYYFKWVS